MKSLAPVFTVWMTGLPSSGKTTIARLLCRHLRRRGLLADIIDGDALRAGWCAKLDFSRRDREENIRRAAALARLLNEAGIVAIVALVSPFRQARRDARQRIGRKRFIEAYVRCPLSVCKKRDVKGLYGLAARGKILKLTGVSGLYESPSRPDWAMDTSRCLPEDCVRTLLNVLRKKGQL